MIDKSQIEVGIPKIASANELRGYGNFEGVFSDLFFISDLNKNFKYDPTDTTSVDDGINTIVNVITGKRYKKVIDQDSIDFASRRLLRTSISNVQSSAIVDEAIFITDAHKHGEFIYDANDTTSLDDGAIVIVDSTGKRFKRQYDSYVNVKWWGLLPDFNTTTGIGTDWYSTLYHKITNKYKDVFLPKGNYYFSVFKTYPNCRIIAEKGTNIYVKRSGSSTPSMVQIDSYNTIEGINFISLESSLDGSRVNIDGKESISFVDCTFQGFRDTVPPINAWGAYLKNSKYIKFINCGFDDNSQSDIAIVDGNHYVTIDNCYHLTNADGVYINVEPNGTIVNRNIHIKNTNINRLTLLENFLTVYATEGVNVESCRINNFTYDGSGAHFSECQFINNIALGVDETEPTNIRVYGGDLDVKADLSDNLIKDANFIDVTNASTGVNSYWERRLFNFYSIERRSDNFGKYTVFNPSRDNTAWSIHTRELIPVDSSGVYAVFLNSRIITSIGDGQIGADIRVIQYDNTSTEISDSGIQVAFNRCLPGSSNQFSNRWGFLKLRSDCKFVRVIVGRSSVSTYEYNMKGVGFFKVNSLGRGHLLSDISYAVCNHSTYKVNSLPNSTSFPDLFKGEILEKINPSRFENFRWLVTESGKGSGAQLSVIDSAYTPYGISRPSDVDGINGQHFTDTSQGVDYMKYANKWVSSNALKINNITFNNSTPQAYNRDEVYIVTRTGNTIINISTPSHMVESGIVRHFANDTTGVLTIIKPSAVTIIGFNSNITLLSNGDWVELVATGNTNEFRVYKYHTNVFINTSLTSAQTSNQLNTLYPNVLIGQEVYAPYVGSGTMYKKVSASQWVYTVTELASLTT